MLFSSINFIIRLIAFSNENSSKEIVEFQALLVGKKDVKDDWPSDCGWISGTIIILVIR
jgi:hypothetical protein